MNVIQLHRGQIILRNITMRKEYKVTFSLLPTVFERGWHSILQFTTGGSCCERGWRIPAVWFHRSLGDLTARSLHFASDVNGTGNHIFNTEKEYPINEWIDICIQQSKRAHGMYLFSIIVNREVVYQGMNLLPTIYNNVTVYAGNPWNESQAGWIKGLEISVGV